MTEESINQMVIGEAVQMEDTHTDSSTAIDNKKNKKESAVFEFFTKDEIKESAQSAVFDPRWKFDFVEFMLNKVHGSRAARQVDIVREKLDSLFEYYSMIVVPNKSVEENEVGESSSVAHLDGEDLLQSFYNFKKTSKRSLPSKNELELYLDEEVFPDAKCFDVLEYWSVNVVKYPILASMARDILAIPVSTVASESAFSTDSRVVSDRHSCLKGSTIEALICTQDWMRGNVPNDQNIDLRGFVDEGCDEEDES